MIKSISYDEVVGWCDKAAYWLKSRDNTLNVGNFRTALRKVGAPFSSERYFSDRFSVSWTSMRLYLSDMEPLPEKGDRRRGGVRASIEEIEDAVRMEDPGAVVVDPSEAEDENPQDVWERMIERSDAQVEHCEKKSFRTVKLPGDKHGRPVGILMCGDVHVGSPATDYRRLDWLEDQINNNPHGRLYITQIGDLMDSMIWGKVALEGRESAMTVPDEVNCAALWLDKMVSTDRFVAMVAGNHDLVSKKMTGISFLDTVMAKVHNEVVIDDTELTLSLMVGDQEYKVVLRHKVKGNSMWNPSQGAAKWMRWAGHLNPDLIVCGHTHRSGYANFKMADQERHCIQVGAYKQSQYDDYAVENGFDLSENISPEMLVLFYPDSKKIRVFQDAELGIDYLNRVWMMDPKEYAKSLEKENWRKKAGK